MKIIKDFLPINNFSRPGIALKQLRGIVIHYTKWPGADSEKVKNLFFGLSRQKKGDDKPDRYAGCHYIINEKEIIQIIPDDEVAYHCGAKKYMPEIQDKIGSYPNYYTIGIEVCHPDDSGEFTEKTIDTLIELVASLLFRNGLQANDIYRHYDIVGKKPDGTICPKFYVDNPKEYYRIINRINIKVNNLWRKGLA